VSNVYLEKVALIGTGIGRAVVGAAAAGRNHKDDRLGGAVAGVIAGHSATELAHMGLNTVANKAPKTHGILRNVSVPLKLIARYEGAALGGLGYSKAKGKVLGREKKAEEMNNVYLEKIASRLNNDSHTGTTIGTAGYAALGGAIGAGHGHASAVSPHSAKFRANHPTQFGGKYLERGYKKMEDAVRSKGAIKGGAKGAAIGAGVALGAAGLVHLSKKITG